MFLQTNSYLVPRDKRNEHALLMKRLKAIARRLGCEHFEVHEEVDPDGRSSRGDSRFVQIMRFRDVHHYRAMQDAERADGQAQELIRDFCRLIGFDGQRARGLFAAAYYSTLIPPESTEIADAQPVDGPVPEAPPQG